MKRPEAMIKIHINVSVSSSEKKMADITHWIQIYKYCKNLNNHILQQKEQELHLYGK